MRPDPRLAALFGIAPQPGALAGGLIRVDETRPLARGVAATPLQFHGGAQQYELAGAEVLAWVSDGDAAGRWPGVVMQRYGRGRAVAWAFDLARSVAYTRQGNPAWANQERDGVDGVRAADMFAGWVDPERLTLPQADELQRLLANLLSALSEEKRPLPRLWYFPGRADSMLIATGDAHQTPPSGIETLLTHVERQHGHLSVYDAGGRACSTSRCWRVGCPRVSRRRHVRSPPGAHGGTSLLLIPTWRAASRQGSTSSGRASTIADMDLRCPPCAPTRYSGRAGWRRRASKRSAGSA
jgi:hypothetical protein